MFTFLTKNFLALLISAIMAICPSLQWNSGVSNDFETYKNVILLIGDGMGINSIKAAKEHLNLDLVLNMERMPVKGWSQTDNILGAVTDSAAGGTALATGIRTYSGAVGVYLWDPLAMVITPQNLTELAISRDKAAGVVTTDSTTGATPASFSSHVTARSENREIVRQQLNNSKLDLIWGGADSSASEEYVTECGYEYVSNATELAELTAGTKSYGQFDGSDLKNVTNNSDTPTIDVMTEKAINILSADEDGFFLMVEGACIDKFSHSNEIEGMSKSLVEFDKAVGKALSFASKDGNTLVVVTADHETGGISYDEEKGEYYYTTGSHTGVDVPLFVSSDKAGFADGVSVMNRQVGAQLGFVMGAAQGAFPTPIDGHSANFTFSKFFSAMKYYLNLN